MTELLPGLQSSYLGDRAELGQEVVGPGLELYKVTTQRGHLGLQVLEEGHKDRSGVHPGESVDVP